MNDSLYEPLRHSVSEAGNRLLWCPLAEAQVNKMKTQGKYGDGYPRGAVVHHTAGNDENEDDARGTLSWGREQGYCYFVIGPTGKIYQSFPLDEWGYHAGESAWPNLGSSVSSRLVGIEVCGAGKLDDNGVSWFGKQYRPNTVREVVESDYYCPSGKYKKFTDEQEESLIKLLVWLYKNNPSVFHIEYILGHHEVSGMKGIGHWRKNDPGGSLSMTMAGLREMVRSKI